LSLAYGVMQKHRGSINVTSALGVGTTFTLRFPVRHDGGDEQGT